jgi:hypothetical protein
LFALGRIKDAIVAAEKARALDPLYLDKIIKKK